MPSSFAQRNVKGALISFPNYLIHLIFIPLLICCWEIPETRLEVKIISWKKAMSRKLHGHIHIFMRNQTQLVGVFIFLDVCVVVYLAPSFQTFKFLSFLSAKHECLKKRDKIKIALELLDCLNSIDDIASCQFYILNAIINCCFLSVCKLRKRVMDNYLYFLFHCPDFYSSCFSNVTLLCRYQKIYMLQCQMIHLLFITF